MTEQAEQKFVAGVGASAALQLAWHWTTVDFKPNVNASVDVCCGVQSQILAEPSSSAALLVWLVLLGSTFALFGLVNAIR